MRLNYPYTTQSNNFFGFREHGNFESKSSLTQFDTSDGQQCYKFFKDFTLHDGHTLTTTDPCRGLYIYVDGDAYIGGTITMNKRGIYSPPTGDYAAGYQPLGLTNVVLQNGNRRQFSLPGALAAPNTAGVNGGCGGGATPRNMMNHANTNNCGAGGIAGVFSAGSGGGGGGYYYQGAVNSYLNVSVIGTAAANYGGIGGMPSKDTRGVTSYWWIYVSGGGAGNPGYYSAATSASTYDIYTVDTMAPAGVLFLICKRLICIDGHKISSDGTLGCISSYWNNSGSRSSVNGTYGGGSGGGSVTVLYSDITGTLNASASGTNLTTDGLYKTPNGSLQTYQILS